MIGGQARHLCNTGQEEEHESSTSATQGQAAACRRQWRQAPELTLGLETRLAAAARPVDSRQTRSQAACARRKGSCAEAGSCCSGAVAETCCSVFWEIVSASAACRALGCGCAGGGSGSGPLLPARASKQEMQGKQNRRSRKSETGAVLLQRKQCIPGMLRAGLRSGPCFQAH